MHELREGGVYVREAIVQAKRTAARLRDAVMVTREPQASFRVCMHACGAAYQCCCATQGAGGR